jgi:hypothetical protein
MQRIPDRPGASLLHGEARFLCQHLAAPIPKKYRKILEKDLTKPFGYGILYQG